MKRAKVVKKRKLRRSIQSDIEAAARSPLYGTLVLSARMKVAMIRELAAAGDGARAEAAELDLYRGVVQTFAVAGSVLASAALGVRDDARGG